MFRRLALLLLLLIGSWAAFGQSGRAPSLALEDCRITAGPGYPGIKARCGTLAQPLNPAEPSAGSIALNVAVVPALSLDPAPDPIVPIAGGPGQSTVQYYAAAFATFERVRQTRDIVLIDQRGTGESARLTCEVDDDLVEGAYSPEQTLLATRECLDALPHDPRYFTTSVAVTDLAALREALGYEHFNLYGISYGTRVAQHYARRYPGSTRTLILDGVVPPQLPLGPGIAIESQAALERVFDRCTDDPNCSERFPRLADTFDRLRQSLAREAVVVDIADPIAGRFEPVEFGTDEFTAAVRLLLYDPRTVALLPLLIDEADKGRYAPLVAQFQMIATSLAEQLSIGMHNAVMCTEDSPFIDWDAVEHEELASTYMGPLQLEAIRTMCSAWPAGVLDADLREPLATDAPVLLLSGSADPITPPAYAGMAAIDLSQAWLLTGENQGHGLAGVGCMPRVISEFIDTMALEEGAAACLDDAFVMPFFVDYTGPTP